jgi:hypothetical protein
LTLTEIRLLAKASHWSSIMSWFYLPWSPWRTWNWILAMEAALICVSRQLLYISHRGRFSRFAPDAVSIITSVTFTEGVSEPQGLRGTSCAPVTAPSACYVCPAACVGYHLQNHSKWLASDLRIADLQRWQQQVCVLTSCALLIDEYNSFPLRLFIR